MHPHAENISVRFTVLPVLKHKGADQESAVRVRGRTGPGL